MRPWTIDCVRNVSHTSASPSDHSMRLKVATRPTHDSTQKSKGRALRLRSKGAAEQRGKMGGSNEGVKKGIRGKDTSMRAENSREFGWIDLDVHADGC